MPVMRLVERRIVRAEVELSVLQRPGDPVVLFLHGLAGYGGEWLGVISHLTESVGLLVPDQRGQGASRSAGQIGVDQADLVGDAVELIEALADGGPVVAVGQSMGGIVGTFLASSHPDLVAALVLIETGMKAMSDEEMMHLRNWLDSWSAGFANVADAREFFGIGTDSAQIWIDGLKWRNERLVSRFDPNQMLDLIRNLASEPRWAEWESIKADKTVVTASSSAVDRTDVARMLELAPSTDHITIRDSGHDAHLDQPKAVATVISQVAGRIKNERT